LKINPIKLSGDWKAGFALDVQTVSSEYIGDDEFGHARFDTKRSEVGELLYRLKYAQDRSGVRLLAETAAAFVKSQRWPVDVIMAVPPSRETRAFQPLHILSRALGRSLGIPVCSDCIVKIRPTPELKSVGEFSERLRLLDGAYSVSAAAIEGRKILLLDDLYRSGATLKAVAGAIATAGRAKEIYVLTFTRTRVKR
jgi:predicted amidophosphoribosyltransferase